MMSDISKRDFIKLGILALSDSACTIVVNPKVMEALYSDEPANIRKVINSYRLLHTTLDYEADNTSYQTNHLGTGIAYGNLILTLDHIEGRKKHGHSTLFSSEKLWYHLKKNGFPS